MFACKSESQAEDREVTYEAPASRTGHPCCSPTRRDTRPRTRGYEDAGRRRSGCRGRWGGWWTFWIARRHRALLAHRASGRSSRPVPCGRSQRNAAGAAAGGCRLHSWAWACRVRGEAATSQGQDGNILSRSTSTVARSGRVRRRCRSLTTPRTSPRPARHAPRVAAGEDGPLERPAIGGVAGPSSLPRSSPLAVVTLPLATRARTS